MTTMIIDNKANAIKSIEVYEIDRYEYQTIADLEELAFDCLNEEVYLIRMFENGKELFTMRNYR